MNTLRRQYSTIEKFKVWLSGKSVVVFTMGKVGTLTVCNSLRNVGYRHVHPHSLRYTRPGVHFIKVPLSFLQKVKYGTMTLLKRVKVMLWKLVKKEIIIITGVRDPYSRNISAYFEQVHYNGGIESGTDPKKIEELFNETCMFDAAIEWFDNEIKSVTGIDVYKFPFDKDKGFTVIEHGKIRLFVYRVDKLNSLSEEMANFIDSDDFEILSTNSSEEGDYYREMETLKSNYRYNHELVEIYSNSKYMNHFFTDEENKKFSSRWGMK